MRQLRRKRAMPSYEAIGDLGALATLSVSLHKDHQRIDEQTVGLQEKLKDYQAYYSQTTAEFERLVESQSVSEDLSINTARSLGVRHKWELLNFFSRSDINGATNIFQYVADDGTVQQFSANEIDEIREWKKFGKYPISDIQGHHIESIKDNLGNIELAAEPDNIVLATPHAHFHILHEGSFHNQTNALYMDSTLMKNEMLNLTLDYNYQNTMEGVSTAYQTDILKDIELGLMSSAITGTIAGVLQFVNIQKMRRKGIVISQNDLRNMKVNITINMIKPTLTLILKNGTYEIGNASVTPISMNMAYEDAGTLLDISSCESEISASLEIAGITTAYLGVTTLNLVGTLIKHNISKERSYLKDQQFKSQMKWYGAELVGFSALGYGLSGVLTQDFIMDQAVDVVTNSLTPSLTFTAAVATYRVGKLGKKTWDQLEERKAYKKCGIIHLNSQYQKALASL